MKILAFDLGSHMGLAWQQIGTGVICTEEMVLPGARPQRLATLLSNLQMSEPSPEIVVYERPFARGQHATRSLWGTAGIIEAWAHSVGAAVVDVTPTEIKKFATGNARAEKVDMIAAAWSFGYTGNNEHEADAVCLLMYANKYITTENASG